MHNRLNAGTRLREVPESGFTVPDPCGIAKEEDACVLAGEFVACGRVVCVFGEEWG